MYRSNTGVWNVYKHPVGSCITNSNNGEGTVKNKLNITSVLHDEDWTTEWRATYMGSNYARFPHHYEIDMGANTKFHYIKITGTGNRNLFDMDSNMEIRVANTKNDLNNGKSVIFSGKYAPTSPYFEFKEFKHGRFLRVTFKDNAKRFNRNYGGRSSIAGITVGERVPNTKVLPTTLRTLKYNGKWTNILVMESIKGEKGSSISYNISLNAGVFGILGDLWNEMGKASVWLNGERVASIDKSMIVDTDINRMKTAHRSFRQVLYFMKLDKTNIKENKIEVKVESGTFIFN